MVLKTTLRCNHHAGHYRFVSIASAIEFDREAEAAKRRSAVIRPGMPRSVVRARVGQPSAIEHDLRTFEPPLGCSGAAVEIYEHQFGESNLIFYDAAEVVTCRDLAATVISHAL